MNVLSSLKSYSVAPPGQTNEEGFEQAIHGVEKSDSLMGRPLRAIGLPEE